MIGLSDSVFWVIHLDIKQKDIGHYFLYWIKLELLPLKSLLWPSHDFLLFMRNKQTSVK